MKEVVDKYGPVVIMPGETPGSTVDSQRAEILNRLASERAVKAEKAEEKPVASTSTE